MSKVHDHDGMTKVGPVYLAGSAVVVGDVVFGEGANVWHHCLIRGDVAPIRVGARVNIQDGSVLHCNKDVTLEIEDDVAIGHQALVHCQSVGAHTLIASRATVLDDCQIGRHCLIAAGAVVTPRTVIPDGSVVMGIPGKVVREITEQDQAYIRRVLETYQQLARDHVAGRYPPFVRTVGHPH